MKATAYYVDEVGTKPFSRRTWRRIERRLKKHGVIYTSSITIKRHWWSYLILKIKRWLNEQHD